MIRPASRLAAIFLFIGLLSPACGETPPCPVVIGLLDFDYIDTSDEPRDQSAEHVSGTEEQYLDADRERMTDLIPSIKKPVIHYKIFAAGRNHPEKAIAFAAAKMRPGDMVCIGVFQAEMTHMLAEDIRLFEAMPAYLQTA